MVSLQAATFELCKITVPLWPETLYLEYLELGSMDFALAIGHSFAFLTWERVFHKIESQVCLKHMLLKSHLPRRCLAGNLAYSCFQRTVGKALVHQTKLTMRGSIGF